MQKITLLSIWAVFSFTEYTMAADLASLTKQLRTLVEINSGSENRSGVDQIQSWLSNELKQLGFKVELGSNRLLVATLKGEDDKTITVVTHADTVFAPSSTFKQFTVKETLKTATGPGVIDDKGGMVVAVDGLKRFLSSHKPKHTLKFIASPAEELGSPGLKDIFVEMSKESWMVLGFEPALDNGSIVKSRRGNRWYNISVTGKEAHAGRAHKDGINACNELAIKIAKISTLTDYKKDVTVSIGHIQGGKDKYNIVCGDASAKIDTRFSTTKDRDKLIGEIEKILKQTYVTGAKTTYEIADDSPPIAPSKEAISFLNRYAKIIENIEAKPVGVEKSGGSADSNNFSREGIIIVDGLGPVGGKIHTEEEFIYLPSLETRAEAFNRFLSEMQ